MIDKNNNAFVKCFQQWCDDRKIDRNYSYIDEFNQWAMQEFDLAWDKEGNIIFGNPEVETMFRLRWA